MIDDELDDNPVVHRMISARGAPMPTTTGASSVFAMGGAPTTAHTADGARKTRPLTGMAALCVQTLAACGALEARQLANETGLPLNQVQHLCANGVRRGYLSIKKAPGCRAKYGVLPNALERLPADASPAQAPAIPAGKSGFNHWLDKKGQSSSEDRPARKHKPSPPPVAVLSPSATTPTGWRWGVFNDGALLLEIDGNDALELSAEQALSLKSFLFQMYPEA